MRALLRRTRHRAACWIGLVALIPAISMPALATPEQWTREGWTRTDFTKRSIEWSEIVSGGPPKDGIPAIDKPKFEPVAGERKISDREAVIGVEINGEARAYPVRILMWHEIVNDVVGGVPVAVTYCPLCNAGIVFERETPHGTLDFGTTGKLRHSDLVMYDRQTESWWQQFTGRAIVGKLTGSRLALVPARLEAFALFKERRPEGQVLVPNDPHFRDYGRNPYEGYDTSAVPFFHRGEFRAGINPMARVVVVREDEAPHAVTLALLREQGAVRLGRDIHVSWRKGQASALDHHTVAGGRDIGNVIAQRVSPDGSRVDVPYDVTFAFVFHAFHPGHDIARVCPERGPRGAASASTGAATGGVACGPVGSN
ncbi:MAG: DUF3179 domain-containing protein [Pseudomonadota bacterium]